MSKARPRQKSPSFYTSFHGILILTRQESLELQRGILMKITYIRTDFPSGRSNLLMRDSESTNPELVHFLLVLSNKGTLWVDVFWPYDEESEGYTRRITEQQFWQTFREWRLQGIILGDNSKVAGMLARKRLSRKQREKDALQS